MDTLSVLKFPDPEGAEKSLHILQDLAKQHVLDLEDAAIVSWPYGKKKPKTSQLASLTGAGALGGGFWGMLFGLIFFVPILGLAIGAAIGALMGSLAPVGIDKDFIDKVRSSITEGTSALFLLTSNVTLDRVVDAFKGIEFEFLRTNLSKEQEEKLREAFGQEEWSAA